MCFTQCAAYFELFANSESTFCTYNLKFAYTAATPTFNRYQV